MSDLLKQLQEAGVFQSPKEDDPRAVAQERKRLKAVNLQFLLDSLKDFSGLINHEEYIKARYLLDNELKGSLDDILKFEGTDMEQFKSVD